MRIDVRDMTMELEHSIKFAGCGDSAYLKIVCHHKSSVVVVAVSDPACYFVFQMDAKTLALELLFC